MCTAKPPGAGSGDGFIDCDEDRYSAVRDLGIMVVVPAYLPPGFALDHALGSNQEDEPHQYELT